MRRYRSLTLVLATLAVAAAFAAPAAHAGCGCEKPPPPPAQVRPAVTYAGMPVALLSPALVPGTHYTVTFTSGVDESAASIDAVAASRRDLADGVARPQVQVDLPALPLGPAAISVSTPAGVVLAIPDNHFTVAPDAVALPEQYGESRTPGYAAAVGRDGVTYVSLDLGAVTQPTVFDARADGYALRFGYEDAVFHNTQGFLMQSLLSLDDPKHPAPMPGMFVFPASSLSSSDSLRYSRHEFDTYFLQHFERQPHALDPSDPN